MSYLARLFQWIKQWIVAFFTLRKQSVDILKIVEKYCQKNDIEFIPVDAEEIDYPGTSQVCTGYFTEKDGKRVLSVALKSNIWQETLLHEMNHGIQCAEGSKLWNDTYFTPEEFEWLAPLGFAKDDDVVDVIHAWIENRIQLDQAIVENFIDRIILMEIDCEKRTAKMCADLIEDFDVGKYAQLSNAYVRSYKRSALLRSDGGDYFLAAPFYPKTFDLDYVAPMSRVECSWFEEA